MSIPPIHQKNAFVAALSAASWSAASWARLPPHEPQLAWTLSASMIANPPPPNGSTLVMGGVLAFPAQLPAQPIAGGGLGSLDVLYGHASRGALLSYPPPQARPHHRHGRAGRTRG